MNPEVKKKWVEALRSGEYKQTSGYLQRNNNYCCLGVLCDLYHKETGDGTWSLMEDSAFPETYSFYGSAYDLPQAVRNWAETTNDPWVEDKTLGWYNDQERVTFSEIANMIEKNL